MKRASPKFSSRLPPFARLVRMEVARRGLEMQAAAKEIGCSRVSLYQVLGGVVMAPTKRKIERWLARSRRKA